MQISLTSKYRKNTDLVMNANELLDLYFYGIDISSTDGTKLSEGVIETYIRSAQSEIEKYLAIKLKKQLETESTDYYRDDFTIGYPVIETSFQPNEAYVCMGMLNSIEQIYYPKQWLTVNKSEGKGWGREISIVPNGSAVNGNSDVILTGVMNQYSFQAQRMVPDYFTVQYTTGFDFKKIPFDLINVIGKFSAIGIFNVLGDLILGAGIASQSLSIDGLSQSISSTSSATNSGYGARIVQYQKEVKDSLSKLKRYYKGYNFVAL